MLEQFLARWYKIFCAVSESLGMVVIVMAPDALLSNADREEALSRAYVDIVAGFVGYAVSKANFDRDGIDVRIHADGRLNPEIGLQLKATVRLGGVHSDGCYHYNDLPVKNYDRLIRASMTPRYLFLLALPRDESEWLTVSVDDLVMRRCGYWVSLFGLLESNNRRSKTVHIPADNVFTPEALQWLLEQSRSEYDGDATL